MEIIAVTPNDIVISTTTDGNAITGQQYGVTCTVLYPEGLTSPINIDWYGPEGLLSNGGGIVTGATLSHPSNITTTLMFNPFRTSHSGRYSCRATILSQSPPYNISKIADVDIIATGKNNENFRLVILSYIYFP